jgi:two-component system nitrate/nitrite response regulator NarL
MDPESESRVSRLNRAVPAANRSAGRSTNIENMVTRRTVSNAPATVSKTRIRIAIAADQPIFRDALRTLFETQPDFVIVGDANNPASAAQLAKDVKADVLLLDSSMTASSGFDALRCIKDADCHTRMIVLTSALDKADTVRALQLGARGIVPKDASTQTLFKSIREVFVGEYCIGRECMSDLVQTLSHVNSDRSADRARYQLTLREREIVELVVAGHTNKDVALTLSISEDTVKHHVTNIFDKTGVSNRLELALFAIHHQLVATAS